MSFVSVSNNETREAAAGVNTPGTAQSTESVESVETKDRRGELAIPPLHVTFPNAKIFHSSRIFPKT